MFGKNYVSDLINRSAENPADRRRFLKTASAAAWEWWAPPRPRQLPGQPWPPRPATSPTRSQTGRS